MIEIANHENVGALKDAIKEKNPAFHYVPADTLFLCWVCIPVNHDVKENLGSLVDEELLLPVDGLSKVFSDVPKEGYLLRSAYLCWIPTTASVVDDIIPVHCPLGNTSSTLTRTIKLRTSVRTTLGTPASYYV